MLRMVPTTRMPSSLPMGPSYTRGKRVLRGTLGTCGSGHGRLVRPGQRSPDLDALHRPCREDAVHAALVDQGVLRAGGLDVLVAGLERAVVRGVVDRAL